MSEPTLKVRERVMHNGEWTLIHKETQADIILTDDGSNVQVKLNDILEWIDNAGGSGSTDPSDFQFVYFDSAAELPNLGNRNTIYIVEGDGEESIYVWNSTGLRYRKIANNYENIKVISGGNATIV